MIKPILIGIWISGVTLGACYAAINWQAGQQTAESKEDKYLGKLEQVQTRAINVPVISDGAIQGYVVAQFAFTVETTLLKRLSIQPESFLLDEAFKIIYNGDLLQFRTMTKGDLPKLAQRIVENVNQRFGGDFVHDVLIQELNFVPRDQARGGPKK